MSRRASISAPKDSLLTTVRDGFTTFEDLHFRTGSLSRPRKRLKTSPNGEVKSMLKEKREQYEEIRGELRKQRDL
jgi:hypothetical protein